MPHEWPIRTDKLALDQGRNGSGIVRPLELSARDKGVEFLLSHTLRTIHREQPFAGRVLDVTVETVDRWFQPQHRFLNLRARKVVVLCSGGHGHNVEFRRMFDPRLTAEYQHHGQATAPMRWRARNGPRKRRMLTAPVATSSAAPRWKSWLRS